MSVDLSVLDEFGGAVSGPGCSVAKALRELEGHDREVFETALGLEKYTSAQLERWCKSKGVRVGQGSISRHRRGECRCGT